MATFTFFYENGTKNIFEHIERAVYFRSERITVSGNQLLTHEFSLGRDICLYSTNSNFTVSGKNLSYIEITSEV